MRIYAIYAAVSCTSCLLLRGGLVLSCGVGDSAHVAATIVQAAWAWRAGYCRTGHLPACLNDMQGEFLNWYLLTLPRPVGRIAQGADNTGARCFSRGPKTATILHFYTHFPYR